MPDLFTLQFKTSLRLSIIDCFSANELRTLCADLGINYDVLVGEEIESKTRELISFLSRRGRLAELVAYCRSARPDYGWPQDGNAAAPEHQISPAAGEADKISILFLAADPTDLSHLRLGEELREIQERLQLSRNRARFDLQQRSSVRPADISQALLDVQAQIVHFSGHGTANGALCFEDKLGGAHPILPEALAALFEQFASQVRCVILNACYSEEQGTAIAAHVDYVIGMNKAIGDQAAIAFALGFYQALGAGRTIEDAYQLGCVQIRLQGIAEHLTPVLLKPS